MSTDVPDKARALLAAYKAGTLDDAGALPQLSALWSEDLGHSTIDHDRERRTGAAEVIFGQSKTPSQLADGFSALAQAGSNVLATRVSQAGADAIAEVCPEATYHPAARLAMLKQRVAVLAETSVAVVSA